jgi:hypothetical protein
MALRITIVVAEPGNKAVKDRFGAKLMEALSEFDSGAEILVEDDSAKDSLVDCVFTRVGVAT